MAGQLPTEVEDFIFRYIDSLEELEVLLLLSNSKEKWWTATSVYQEIKSSLSSISRRLEGLSNKGLLTVQANQEKSYQYAPASPELESAVQSLRAAYAERRLKVLESLYSKPLAPLRIFSDAFRIRKDPKDG